MSERAAVNKLLVAERALGRARYAINYAEVEANVDFAAILRNIDAASQGTQLARLEMEDD